MLWWVKPALIAGALAAGIGGAWALHRHVWQQGYRAAQDECRAADQAARLAQLERELAQALTAASVGQHTRTVVQERVSAINVEVQQSVEIIRAGWDRPSCVLPDRVRAQLQDGINKANAAAGRL